MMRRALQDKYDIDLNAVGNWLDIDVRDVTTCTLVATDGSGWGAAVVAVEKLIGGDRVAYSPAVVLNASTVAVEGLEVFEAPALRLRVTTAGTGFGRIVCSGKIEDTLVEAL